MVVARIPCPKCRKELKVKDPALLGRKVKCPGCGHRFVLEMPADESSPGTAETAVYKTSDLQEAAASPPVPESDPESDSIGTVPAMIDTGSEGGVQHLKALKRRSSKRRSGSWIGAVVFVGLAAGSYFLLRPYLTADAPKSVAAEAPDPVVDPAADEGTDGSSSEAGPSPVDQTSENPITLRMVPSGVRLIANLRPSELFGNKPQMAEFRASLTEDVTGWLETQIRTVCRHEPAEIEEVLFAWILGARGSEPQLTAVVHLVQDARMSELLDKFGHDALDEFAQTKVYVKDDTATLILDTKTFAIAPREFGAELTDWIETPNYNTSDGLLELLPHTDRDRLVTVLFEPADVPRHLEALVSPPARPAIAAVADWFTTGAQAETVSWSLQTDEAFHSELLVRGPRTAALGALQERLSRHLEELPPTMAELVRRMRPQRSGFRKLIGRFPAMLEVSRMATVIGYVGRSVQLKTVLPPKAAPNLALGTVLTWDESTRTDLTAEPPAMAAVNTGIPKTVVERMQLPVDAEFNRVPLQEALDYIAGEIRVTSEIDGDALKDAGFTKNMAQTFNLGKVSAEDALAFLVKQYEEPGKRLVLVVDEPRKTIILLTEKFAVQRGLTIHEFRD